jgi:uncharacterized protein YcbX
MLGERLAEAAVVAAGLDGDRRYALVHAETGRVASAKLPRLWRGLLALSATVSADGVRIEAPDGTVVRDGDPGADEILSKLVGAPVTLAATPPVGASFERAVPDAVLDHGVEADVPVTIGHVSAGSAGRTFVDYAPLHLITTGTLEAISSLGGPGLGRARRYRPNIVIRTGAGFLEDGWLGGELHIGDSVALRVTLPTPRCALPTLDHGPLAGDPAALRVLAAYHRMEPLAGMGPQPCAGVYAEVLRAGPVRVGDPVILAG